VEKILIIDDDDEVSRYLIKGLLEDTSYTIIEAQDGVEGLRRAAKEQPQIIFLDLIMPGMTGFEVLDRLKSNPATRDIPVIISTSKVLEEKERRLLTAETLGILSKKTSRQAALTQIREALIKVQARQQGPPALKEKLHG